MSNTIRLQKTGNGDCVYMHLGKKLYISNGSSSDTTGSDTTGFDPLIINGEIKTIETNAKFDKIGKSNKVGVTIKKVTHPLYTKQRVGAIENESMELLKCNDAGYPIPLPTWTWKCIKNKYCIPTMDGTGLPSYTECKETCGLTEDDNVNYILSIISIVLISLVLLIFVFIVMFSNDINNGTTSFFKNLLVILFITAVILLSVIAYRLSN